MRESVCMSVRCVHCGVILGIVEYRHMECFFVDARHTCEGEDDK